MIINVLLTPNEYEYLLNVLLMEHKDLLGQITFEHVFSGVNALLDEDVAFEIRELASDEVGLHFDENYEPTEEGWILEHFIDKFYFDEKR